MGKSIFGQGGKRIQLEININNIFLDPDNPRLKETDQGGSERELLLALYNDFYLEELAESFASNGYFDEEPIVIIPKNLPAQFLGKEYSELKEDKQYKTFLENPNTKFTVVEGNRRISAIKILLFAENMKLVNETRWPELPSDAKEDLENIPAIIYSTRKEIIPYLGIRHISGIKKWDSYAKARYIANMVNEGYSIEEVKKSVGDRGVSVIKSYVCYKVIELMEEEEEESCTKAKEFFSYLLLSLGQNPVKEFLGLPKKWKEINLEEIIPADKFENLKILFSFLFGEKGKRNVISESRDITKYLTHILKKDASTNLLIKTRDLQFAYERSDGEEILIKDKMAEIIYKLETVNAIIYKYKGKEDIKQLVVNCKNVLDDMLGRI